MFAVQAGRLVALVVCVSSDRPPVLPNQAGKMTSAFTRYAQLIQASCHLLTSASPQNSHRLASRGSHLERDIVPFVPSCM